MVSLVTVTAAALEQLRAALAAADDPELGLRAAARRTASGEIEFGLGLDEPREQDEQIEIDEGVTVLVSVASRDLIAGTEIDYVEVAPGEFRFVFFRAGEESDRAPDVPEADAPACGNCGCGAAAECTGTTFSPTGGREEGR